MVKERVSLIYWCLVCVHVFFPIMSNFVCFSRVCVSGLEVVGIERGF